MARLVQFNLSDTRWFCWTIFNTQSQRRIEMVRLINLVVAAAIASTSGAALAGSKKQKKKSQVCYTCPEMSEGDTCEKADRTWIKAKSRKSCEKKGGTWDKPKKKKKAS